MVLHRGEQHSARAQLAWFLFWSACLLVSLRAAAQPDPRLAWLTAPLRFAADLASPLHLVRAPRVHAAEGKLVRSSQEEAEEHLRVLENLARFAEPSDPRIREGRYIVPGEVIGRVANADKKDLIRIHLRDGSAVRRGQPVACGDAYVGRIDSIRAKGSEGAAEATVELVTSAGFSVGGRMDRESEDQDEEVFLIVGGLSSRRSKDTIRLAVQYPSDPSITGGEVCVYERFAEAEEFAQLAEGLLLGRLERYASESSRRKRSFGVVPILDYRHGLYRVVVLAPEESRPETQAIASSGLAHERWLRTRALVFGDPSPWRSATKIPAGRLAGIEPGAAITGVGGRLLGRVSRAGPLAADVSFLDDTGLALVAMATFVGHAAPRVLGRLTSLGRDSATGFVRMRWEVGVSLGEVSGWAEDAPARARLFTGSGDEGLPAGLFFGEAELPVDVLPGEIREILVESDVSGADVRALYARIAPSFNDPDIARGVTASGDER